jgi:hypothetical protein
VALLKLYQVGLAAVVVEIAVVMAGLVAVDVMTALEVLWSNLAL